MQKMIPVWPIYQVQNKFNQLSFNPSFHIHQQSDGGLCWRHLIGTQFGFCQDHLAPDLNIALDQTAKFQNWGGGDSPNIIPDRVWLDKAK